MSDTLRFFERVYGEVPEWVQKMYQQNSGALEAYTALRCSVMEEGALSRKEKEWILVGVNAARRYERSMLYHTKGAMDAGSTPDELAEILLPCILSRGLPAWLEGYKALDYAQRYLDEPVYTGSKEDHEKDVPFISSVEEALAYYEGETSGSLPTWVQMMSSYSPGALQSYANLRQTSLSDGRVPRKAKELVLVGINLSERYPDGVSLHTRGARRAGATDGELAEVALTCVLTAGIPAWFEMSDLLHDR